MGTQFEYQFLKPNEIKTPHIWGQGLEVKGSDLGREGGIFMSYSRTGVWFGLLFNPCMGFSGYCHGNCQLSWADGCVIQLMHLANCGMRPKDTGRQIFRHFGLAGSNQFLFFSLQFPPETGKSDWCPFQEKQEYNSGTTTLVTKPGRWFYIVKM